MDEASVFIILGVLWIIAGVVLIVLAAVKWNFSISDPRFKMIPRVLNHMRTRVFCAALGVAWLISGILFVTGAIPPN
ncbi:MAG: hypothetical protein HN929_09625 [Chloroflexi bacterium]|jgi:hypothetical protein|nr:hypothetical protein [Chloroflexota bacterium]MBT7081708.1 hypothetical protein [Chloroflexota bacterium]MBT7289151.1 hypothetical protein [Chloroflexota bacterium]